MKNIIIFLLIIFQISSYEVCNSEEGQSIEVEKVSPPYFQAEFTSEPQYDDNHFFNELINMLVTLGGIVILLIGVTWIMKRMQSTRIKYTNSSSLIKIADHRALSTKTGIYLIHVHGRAILIADSQNGATHLADFPIDSLEGNFDEEVVSRDKKKFNDY